MVYLHPDDPDYVIKIPRKDKARNYAERDIYDLARGEPEGELLMPVVHLSRDGNRLVMPRAEVNTEPVSCPDWVRGGRQPENWGWRGGQLLLIDYAEPRMLDRLRRIIEARS